MGTSKGPSKSSKGVASSPAPDTPFFSIALQKGKDAAPKGATKAKIRARTRVAIKARLKGKVMTCAWFLPCAALSPKTFLGGSCMHWRCFRNAHSTEATDCVSGFSFWTPFSTKVWLGLTICWRRTSERNLNVGSLHALVPCFTRFHQALGWSSCLALSNQQACVRPTVSLDDQGRQERVSLPGPWCSFLDLHLPRLRFPPYGFLATGSPRLTAF